MKEKTTQTDIVEEQDTAAVLICEDGIIKEINEPAAEMYGENVEDIEGRDIFVHLDMSPIEVGRCLAEAIQGDKDKENWTFKRADGSSAKIHVEPDPITIDGENYVLCKTELIREYSEEETNVMTSDVLEDVPDDQIAETTKNIRIETNDGTMPLSEILVDVAATQNQIQQQKEGAYTLYRVLSDRLEEEEKRGTDPVVCEIIREAREAVKGIYLRIERGDAELQGKRDGEYSDYLN